MTNAKTISNIKLIFFEPYKYTEVDRTSVFYLNNNDLTA